MFDDVVGQDHITTTLKNQIESGRIGHAYLFVGSRGCGKTTSARIFAKEINLAGLKTDAARHAALDEAITEGRHMDIIEFDAASHTGVDNIREILEKVPFRPTELPYKVYVIDEVHMLSTSAYNALLKTLEEPPSHVVFILATTDPQKIPATVISRCQRFNFKRVPINLMVKRLRTICDAEKIDADDLALTLIARQATGALRDAVSLLDQISSSSSMRISPDDVRETLGATDAATVKAIAEAMINRDPAGGLGAIQRAMDQGADARQIARQMIETLRTLTQLRINKNARAGSDLSEGERQTFGDLAERAQGAQLLQGIRAFSAAINEMRSSSDAQLALEMALLDCVVEPAHAVAAAPQQHSQTAEPRTAAADGRPAATEPRAAQAPARASVAPAATLQEGAAAGIDAAVWRLVLAEVGRQSKPTQALLNSTKLLGVEGTQVQIKPHHKMAYENLNDAKKIAAIAAAINTVTSGNYSVHLISPEASATAEAQEDPVLKAARKLGGTVRT